MDTTWKQVMQVIAGVSALVFGFMLLQRLIYNV